LIYVHPNCAVADQDSDFFLGGLVSVPLVLFVHQTEHDAKPWSLQSVHLPAHGLVSFAIKKSLAKVIPF
jgi:hypothetical protein